MVVEACSVAMLALKAGNNQDMSPKGLHDKRIPDLHLAGPFVTAAAALGNASSGRTVSNGGGSFNHSQHSLSLNSPPPLKLSMNFTMTPPKSKSAKELMLCPSAAPTPRKPSFSGNFQVRPAQIWAPSAGTANDFARVRNGGKSLLTKQMVGLPASDLLRVSSAPILASAVNNAVSSSPKTPRAARGMVRKVSKVLCNYPEVNFLTMAAQQKPPTPPSVEMAYRPASSARSFSEPPSGPKRHTKKRVSFADQVPEELQHISTSVSPQGSQTRALKKSMRLLDALHDLRRVDKDEEEAAAAAAAAAAGDANGATSDVEVVLNSSVAEGLNLSAAFRKGAHARSACAEDCCKDMGVAAIVSTYGEDGDLLDSVETSPSSPAARRMERGQGSRSQSGRSSPRVKLPHIRGAASPLPPLPPVQRSSPSGVPTLPPVP